MINVCSCPMGVSGCTFSWDNAKALLIRETFFQELEFYDKDNIPDDIYMSLADYFFDPSFTVDSLAKTSHAVSHLCMWVRSVYEYATISRGMRPKMNEVASAEEELTQVRKSFRKKYKFLLVMIQ